MLKLIMKKFKAKTTRSIFQRSEGKDYVTFLLIKKDENVQRLYVHEVLDTEKLQQLTTGAVKLTGADEVSATHKGAIRNLIELVYGINTKDDMKYLSTVGGEGLCNLFVNKEKVSKLIDNLVSDNPEQYQKLKDFFSKVELDETNINTKDDTGNKGLTSDSETPKYKKVHKLITPIYIDGKIFGVKLTVKEHIENGNKLYDLKSIEIKMPDGISETTSQDETLGIQPTSGTINLKDLIESVNNKNPDFLESDKSFSDIKFMKAGEYEQRRRLKYIDKTKSLNWSQSVRLYLPKERAIKTSNPNLFTNDDIFKGEDKKNLIYSTQSSPTLARELNQIFKSKLKD